ncbi:MAG: ribulokinase [Armatimonadota bacterium]
MSRYALGLDFGTESGRALLVDISDGREVATAIHPYPHGVVDEQLPDGGPRLEPDWALQDPDDYWAVLEVVVPEVLRQSGASADEVIGIGVDFTACTLLPVLADGTPLSRLPEHRQQPHAWGKLWKHHAAQPEAERINELAAERGESFLARYGGKTSSEWLFAKAWQLLDEAPELYDRAERLVEAGDWLVWQLTGREVRSACQAGYKGMWSRSEGYPSAEFLAALHPRLASLPEEKLRGEVLPVGARAGELTEAAARRLGLRPGTAVAVSLIDAHAGVPAAGVSGPGKMLLILGTSCCHLVLGQEEKSFEGIAGVVQDGILPGFLGYEAGQPATGDILAWHTRHALPAAYAREAEDRGVSPHQVLVEKAATLRPGETGLLALDWWNGNRSVLMDADLSGALIGLTLDTRAEDIYRALIEGTAFGTRAILENFARNGVEVEEIIAAGGLSEKNELLMQIYADVTGRPIRLARSGQACALGAAILGAVAAGEADGGYGDLPTAVERMGGVKERCYTPDPAAHELYSQLFREWMRLHDYFGRGGNEVLKTLRALRG